FRCLAARCANLSAQRCIDDSESPNASLTRRWLQPRVPSKAVTSRFSPSENRGRVFPLVSRSCCTRRLSASIRVSSIHAVSRQNARHARRGSATGYDGVRRLGTLVLGGVFEELLSWVRELDDASSDRKST